MDGTLVDTEPHWIAAEAPLVESFGGTWTEEQALAVVGLGLEDAARILQDAGVRMPVAEIIDTLTDHVCASVAADLPYRPGARELLLSLREAGVPTALVTMSMRRMATSFVDAIGFDAFDLVIGGDDAIRPKPFPDPYLQAAEGLGVDIRDCVVIEDSPTGTRAGVASGAAVLGVPHMVSLIGVGAHRLASSLSDVTLADLEALLAQTRDERLSHGLKGGDA